MMAVDSRRGRIMSDVSLVRTAVPPPLVRQAPALSSPNSNDRSSLVERCVLVTKQHDGYGLTVTGDHPVFVASVKPGGSAYCAGVRQGDRILKVNGMPVTSSNHMEVVRMISGGQCVALTLLGKPPEPMIIENFRRDSKPYISDPIPLEDDQREEWRRRRVHELNQMLQDELNHVESLRETCIQGPQIDRALHRIKNLQAQLRSISGSFDEKSSTPDPNKVEPVRSWVDSGGMQYVQSGVDVIPMDDGSDEDEPDIFPMENQGPFANLADLKSRPAHLAVFINYLLSNSDPSSLLFYLITDAYQTGNFSVKELRRFAYEIFSTFLIPNAPLQMPNISQPLIQAIDKILRATVNCTDHDIDQLKKLFIPSRTKALDDINDCLADFRQKRQIGLGSMFDSNQLDSIGKSDPTVEIRVGEQILITTLGNMLSSTNNDLDNCDSRALALIMSLASVIKVVLGIKPSSTQWEKLLEKCPTFLTSMKSSMFKMKPMISKRVVQIKGHQFVLQPVNLTVHCYQCRYAIWGVNAQAYFCQNCDVKVHKQCTSQLVDHCYPATQHKSKAITAKSRSRPNMIASAVSSTAIRDHSAPVHIPLSAECETLPRTSTSMASLTPPATITLGRLDRSAPELPIAPPPPVPSESPPPHPPSPPPQAPPPPPTKDAKSQSSDSGIGTEYGGERSVSRSQSMKSKKDRLPSRTPGSWNQADLMPPPDETYEQPISSRRSESDSRPERPGLLVRAIAELGSSVSGSSSLSQTSINEEEAKRMLEKIERTVLAEGDSDLEVDTEVPSLETLISWEVLKHLKPKEKKRQEVINELFHTERTHVRNLKILYRVFYRPMAVQKIVGLEVVKLLFSNLDEVLEIHSEMKQKMRIAVEMWKRDSALDGLYGEIGDLMEGMFDGGAGERLMNATAAFCQHQQHALDFLRQVYNRPRDDPLLSFLTEAESNPLCRKLQLKDMLPVEMQRLVKYPLLLETIAKYTKDPSDELDRLLNSINGAKRILSAVNTAKRHTENIRRLEDLQKRLDTSSDKDGIETFLGKFDFTKHRLIYEGPLTWRQSRGKMMELHVVLLEHLLVFLTKSGDGNKLQLKIHEPGCIPIMKLSSVVVKEKANDKRALQVLYSCDFRLFELVAATATERKTWHRLIELQVATVKQERGGDADSEIPLDFQSTPSHPKLAQAQLSGEETTPFTKLEKVNVITHPRLVSANEITIQQPTVLEHAQPILTPTEKLRRDDKVIFDALIDKHQILSQFLEGDKQGSGEELDRIAELMTGLSVAELKQRTSKELAMSAIVHGNRLLDSINKGMSWRKDDSDGKPSLDDSESHLPSVPCYKLTGIAAPLMNHLKALMQVVQDQQNEINTLKQQLYHYKEIAEGDRTVSEETLTEARTPVNNKHRPSS